MPPSPEADSAPHERRPAAADRAASGAGVPAAGQRSARRLAILAIGALAAALVCGYIAIAHYRQLAQSAALLAELHAASVGIARATILAAQGDARALARLREHARAFHDAIEGATPRAQDVSARVATMPALTHALAPMSRQWATTRGNIETLLASETDLKALADATETLTRKDPELLDAAERLLAQIDQSQARWIDRNSLARALAGMQRITKAAAWMVAANRADAEAVFDADTEQRIVDESLARLELTLRGNFDAIQRLRRLALGVREQFNAYWTAVNVAAQGYRRLATLRAAARSIRADADHNADAIRDLQSALDERSRQANGLASIAALLAGITVLGCVALARVRFAPTPAPAPLDDGEPRIHAALQDMREHLGRQAATVPPAANADPETTIRALSAWAGTSMAALRERQEQLIACLRALASSLQQAREDAIAILETYQAKSRNSDALSADARQSVDRSAAILSAARASVQSFETIAAQVAKGAQASQTVSRRAGALRERTRIGDQRLHDLCEDLSLVADAVKQAAAAAERLDDHLVNAAIPASNPALGTLPEGRDDGQRLVRRILEYARRTADLVERLQPRARDVLEHTHPSIADAEVAAANTDDVRYHFEHVDRVAHELMNNIETICAQAKEVASRAVAVWEGVDALNALDARAGEHAMRIVEASGNAVQQLLDHLPPTQTTPAPPLDNPPDRPQS